MTALLKIKIIILIIKIIFKDYFSKFFLIQILYQYKTKYYSVLSASTGSFFDAILAGIDPPSIVKLTLIIINIIA